MVAPLAMLGLTSCDTWSPAHLEVPSVSTKAYQIYKTKIDQSKNIIEQKCVFINGLDIQLPLTSGDFDPQDNRTYSFYIWAYDADAPITKTLEEMREDGSFSLEVIGVKASISLPDYLPASGPPQQLLRSVTNGISSSDVDSMKSRNVLEVRIRSQDLTGPFTIVAWFPDKYRNWQANQWRHNDLSTVNQGGSATAQENPYGEKREVKVYNGDLRTRIDIVDEREAESSFGRQFAKHFYVGRIYLRNRHPDKRMVVYTTSLRANLLFYRPPLAVPYTNQPAGKSTPSAAMFPSQQQYTQEELTHRQKDQLRKRSLTNQTNSAFNYALNRAISQAFYQSAPNIDAPPDVQSDQALIIAKSAEASTKTPLDEQDTDTITSAVTLVWNRLDQQAQAAEDAAEFADAQGASIARDELSTPPMGSDEEQVLRVNIFSPMFRLGLMGNDGEINGHYYSATNAVAKSGLSSGEQARLISLAQKIREQRLHASHERMLATALRNDSPQILDAAGKYGEPMRQEYDKIIGEIRQEALADNGTSPNPFATTKDILVNTDGKALAFSDSSDRQVQLDKVGYLWHDTYRPMTFQAVLNSLMYTDANSYSARTMELLQTAATLAGGMAGLSGVANGFASQGYLQGANFFSAIFVPAAGKLILDDLNKHIRNLGDMGMDTVVIVPPNDVVDHYIFFPKGPIYNFVDEFNVSDPAYIKDIDNDDVAVEATLIDQGVNVQGGGLSSDALTDRALNEGQSDISAEVTKQANLSERLRQLTLSTTAAKMQALLAGTSPADTNGVKTVKRIQAEKQVCSLVKTFEASFGADTTGTLSELLSQNNVDCDNSPPVVMPSAVPTVDLLNGVPSEKLLLPVSDVMGIWSLQITNFPSDAAFIASTNVLVQLPMANTAGSAYFTVLAATNAAQNEDVTTTITFTISNSLALSTTLPVPVTIHAPRFQFQNIQGGKKEEGTFTLSDPNTVATMNVVLPLYNSDMSGNLLTNWTFAPINVQSNGWVISSDPNGLQKIPGGGAGQALAMILAIDASTATNQTLPLNLSISYRNQVIVSTNLQIVIPGGSQ
jgi:hypothetical protein